MTCCRPKPCRIHGIRVGKRNDVQRESVDRDLGLGGRESAIDQPGHDFKCVNRANHGLLVGGKKLRDAGSALFAVNECQDRRGIENRGHPAAASRRRSSINSSAKER